MNYEEFKDQLLEDIKDRLSDADVTVSTHEVQKLNESYDAITVTPKESNVGVNLPVNNFYEAMEDGMPYEVVLDKAVNSVQTAIERSPQVDVESLTDYSQMKEKLAMEVVSADANKELLENIPHRTMEDMAVVYRFVLSSDEEGRASVLVTNQILETMGVTPEQLHADAMEIAPQIKPAEIKGMSEVLAELMGMEQAEMMGIPMDPKDEQMYVASVPDKVHGAGVLAYENFMDQAAERAGGDFFILPSSIHEILIVPDNGEMDLKTLENMVREVNATQVAPEDKLTDSVYHYDSKDKIFELGEKFEARQAAKELAAKAQTAEEKGSLLGELKEKKDVAAKTPKAPKKEDISKGVKGKGGDAL